MNVILRGSEAEFAGYRFLSREGAVTILDPSGTVAAAPRGLATAIVRALGGELPKGPIAERRITVDQTNVSVVVAERWIVKLIIELGTADRSALIEQRFAELQSRQDPAGPVAPEFLGSVSWQLPGRHASTVALVSRFVSDAEDGWTWAPADVIAASPEHDPDWPRALGVLTARMHLALAAAEFPEDRGQRPAPAEEVAAVYEEVAAAFAQRADPAGARIRNRLPAIREALRGANRGSRASGIVIHGDFHVGQVIRDPAGTYRVVDFDGDPQWGGSHPWRRFPAARDVAHMTVAIDHVAAVVQKRRSQADGGAFAWADRAKRAYLDAYTAELAAAGAEHIFDAAQLPWMCAEQLLLELRYASRYLPGWEYAPDAVITHRYPSSTQESETPWTPPDSQKI